MCAKFLSSVLLLNVLVIGVLSHPTVVPHHQSDDTNVVGSNLREVRAAAPYAKGPEHIEDLLELGVDEAFLYKYGKDGVEEESGDEQGYVKKSQDKGSDGYKHFDSFHKKDGDKYGFEKHSQYGDESKAEIGNNDDGDDSVKAHENDEEHAVDDGINGEEAETRKTYKVVENVNEDKAKVSNLEAFEDDDLGFHDEETSNDHFAYNDAEETKEEDGEDEESDDHESSDDENNSSDKEEESEDDGKSANGEGEHYSEIDEDGESYTEDDY